MIRPWKHWSIGTRLLASASLASGLGFILAMGVVTGRASALRTRSAQE